MTDPVTQFFVIAVAALVVFLGGVFCGRSARTNSQICRTYGKSNVVIQSGNNAKGDIVGGNLYRNGTKVAKCEYCGGSNG